MDAIRCCVIDDEPLALKLISSYVGRTAGLELAGAYLSAEEASEAIGGGDFDAVFLDIQMPGVSGVEFAKTVPPSTRIIFVTAYSDYAVEGFRVNAIDYLLKPVSYDEFVGAVNRVRQWKKDLTHSAAVIPRAIISRSRANIGLCASESVTSSMSNV